MAELTAEHTGQTVDQIEQGRRPGPLVHRRRGAGLRLHRPRSSASGQPGAPEVWLRPSKPTRHAKSGVTMSEPYSPSSALHPAVLRRAHDRTASSESNPYNKLFEERIIFLGAPIDDVVGQRRHRAAHLPRVRRTPTATSSSTSTRPAARSPRSPRSTTRMRVRPARHPDVRAWARRRRPPRCCWRAGAPGQAVRAAELAGS